MKEMCRKENGKKYTTELTVVLCGWNSYEWGVRSSLYCLLKYTAKWTVMEVMCPLKQSPPEYKRSAPISVTNDAPDYS